MRKVVLHGRALFYVALARALLRGHDTTWTLRRITRARSPRARHVDGDSAVVAVRRAGRMAKATCLPQSVALVALLARDGVDPVLVLGCRRYEDRTWGAHAWVELGEKVLEPVPAGAHEELAVLQRSKAWIPTPRD